MAVQELMQFIDVLIKLPIEYLIAVVALGCLALAAFAIHAVSSIARERR